MARIVLVGMPGVGKSTVGRAVATALHCEALDIDDLLEETLGQPVADFIRHHGIEPFRIAETAALRVALASDGVVSCGGGVVTDPSSREILQATPRVVWLTAPIETLGERIRGGDRPLLGTNAEKALAELLDERESLYADVADVAIDANRPVSAVVEEVVAFVGKST